MDRRLCLLHANCQGDMLRPLLEAAPAFARRFQIRQYRNYMRESMAQSELDHCALFLYQKLAPKWGPLSTEQILPRLPPSATRVEIPNLFFKGYWPFWQSGGPISFADSLLERLLSQGPPEAALNLYLRGSAALLGDAPALAAAAEDSIRREEAKEADAPVRCAPLLRERWREEQLFLTVNHPGPDLILHVADSLLRLLGMGGLPPSARRAYVHPYDDFWLPIHPGVGHALGLPFASAERRYRVCGLRMTHADYAAAYIACRAHGVADLLAFLRGMSDGRMEADTRLGIRQGACGEGPTVS